MPQCRDAAEPKCRPPAMRPVRLTRSLGIEGRCERSLASLARSSLKQFCTLSSNFLPHVQATQNLHFSVNCSSHSHWALLLRAADFGKHSCGITFADDCGDRHHNRLVLPDRNVDHPEHLWLQQ